MTRSITAVMSVTAVLVPLALLMSATSETDKIAANSTSGRLMSSRAGSCAALLRD